ncbi:uncharacterized protein TOL2_C07060 [Desulfobacula toluolica Tol2]|uniref:Prepilin-type N-terminal cleavage/methylation domain-containing protein n=2 Tax=Desulfobacula toluolica TaxID=28223 RepID=K0NDK9_DESTT|nr:uncharacterized protein TOL2_C07060 [Desulfobacula toluolica Tol2]
MMTHKNPAVLANEKGFTLVEIIAVLVILGILAAVAVPKFMDLQADARAKAAQSAISEVKSRLSMGYGQYLLKNSEKPTTIVLICGEKGVNDDTILPKTGKGSVPMGADFTVTLDGTTKASIGTITVTKVQGKDVTVTDDWDLPI